MYLLPQCWHWNLRLSGELSCARPSEAKTFGVAAGGGTIVAIRLGGFDVEESEMCDGNGEGATVTGTLADTANDGNESVLCRSSGCLLLVLALSVYL